MSCRVITVTSMKGGVGKTETSLNLAAAIRKETGKKVMLIDFDIPYGGVAQALALKKYTSISDWIKTNRNISEEGVESLSISHKTGIDILPAIANAHDVKRFSCEVAERIIQNITLYYDFIVIDTGVDFSFITQTALQKSDHIILVTSPQNTSIWNNHQYKEDIIQLGIHPQQILVFVNQVVENPDITFEQVKEVFLHYGHRINSIFTAIQDDRVRKNRNLRGVIYLDEPAANFSRSIYSMLKILGIAIPDLKGRNKGWISNLLRLKRRLFC
ncbi:cobQ/CobB/MinD/ParA nucleotide binding domain protein [Brevibacillus laterosporus GI-9]|uniref:AAA family ATPase n=1 Tax=Brevibacillus laterosporus TaxID=1465 RepID=UPI00024051FE|nr:MinD/ParA family protein [Brevibacillus laterosporus]CCF16505.1 cobQ/CobB/MinD/ParA nucleotide binding domain protein [Brevibacillus laterosporus GI-9]